MFFLKCCLFNAALGYAAVLHKKQTSPWQVSNFNSLVTFGDSYTDENRLNYFAANNGSAPPPGTFLPETFHAPSGGRTWPRYVVQYTGSTINGQWDPRMTLYDYAVSGAVCSNNITPRTFSSINANFPSVLEYEVPAFIADLNSTRNGTDMPYFSPTLSASDAIYAMFIGTNDLGVYAFMTDSQVPGNTLSSYTECVYAALDQIYMAGARNLVLMNVIPLELAALYSNASSGGQAITHYWPGKPANLTQISLRMGQFTTSVDSIFMYQTPFEALVAGRWPGANVALFNVRQLIQDIYDSPTDYLNGTQPANVTGFEHHCDVNGTVCEDAFNGTSSDSFLFYDELHPSEQTDRIIARNFVQVLNGSSPYAQYY